MKVLPIMGDPQSVANALAAILQYNPEMRIVSMSVCPWMLQPGNMAIHTPAGAKGTPVHVLYVVYDGVSVLVGENGQPIEQPQ